MAGFAILAMCHLAEEIFFKRFQRKKPACRIDRLAVVTDDATRLAVYSNCTSLTMSRDARAEDEIAGAVAIDGKRTIAQIGGPSWMLGTQVSNDVVRDELPDVAVAVE